MTGGEPGGELTPWARFPIAAALRVAAAAADWPAVASSAAWTAAAIGVGMVTLSPE